MSATTPDDRSPYNVVINGEEQYSIWRADRPNALGWREEGFTGTLEECLAHIETDWTDMRPLSLRAEVLAPVGAPREGQATKA